MRLPEQFQFKKKKNILLTKNMPQAKTNYFHPLRHFCMQKIVAFVVFCSLNFVLLVGFCLWHVFCVRKIFLKKFLKLSC